MLDLVKAILAFLGAFVLIRYRLADASAHMPQAIHTAPPSLKSPPNINRGHEEKLFASSTHHQSSNQHLDDTYSAASLRVPAVPDGRASSPLARTAAGFVDRLLHMPIFVSPDIVIEVVRPFRRTPRNRKLEDELSGHSLDMDRKAITRLLLRCHHACSLFVLLGFTLLIIGIVSFAWLILDRAVSIFVSASVVFAILVAGFALH